MPGSHGGRGAKNSPRNEKKLIAMQLAMEHADIANRERSLSRSSASTASGASVRSVPSLSRSSGNTASGASVRSVPSSRHTMTVCKAFSSIDNQTAPAISTTQVPQPEGHVSVPHVVQQEVNTP